MTNRIFTISNKVIDGPITGEQAEALSDEAAAKFVTGKYVVIASIDIMSDGSVRVWQTGDNGET